jgi:hypothetical protein
MNKEVRPRLTEEEYSLLLGIRDLCEEQQLNLSDVKHGWAKGENSSLFFRNPDYKPPLLVEYEELQENLITDLEKYSPSFPVIKRTKNKDSYLLVVDPADIHLGKLCS